MAERCRKCGQPIPIVAHCSCGHTRAEHSIKQGRRVLTRAQCFVQDCPCVKYVPLNQEER